MDLKSGKTGVFLDMGDATGDFYNGKNGKKKTDVRKKAVVVAQLVFVLWAAPDEQKGVSTLKADENKTVFPMAYILVLSMFWGLGHYGIAAVER